MQNFYKFILAFLFLAAGFNYSNAQVVFTVSGTVTSSETGEAISGAVVAAGTKKAATDSYGKYSISGLMAGTYTITATYVGYVTGSEEVSVTGNTTVNFNLKTGSVNTEEIIVEINRAKDRETPVAFTDVTQKQIEARINGQDAPLLTKNVPGLYAYSTDGVGNGETKMLVRGFSQNYVQVLINGIPTNDPESNSVFWSNWGGVSANAGSIQIQRGAGSSLYGAGSFGGSFNILTETPSLTPFYGANLTLGSPLSTMYGINIGTGLVGKFAGALNVDRKIGEGSRISGRYEGYNYYTSMSYYMTSKQTLNLVLHGGPQEHGFSNSGDAVYFAKYGYKANPSFFLPVDVVTQLPANATTGKVNYGLQGDYSRTLDDGKFVNIATNFFHKPQLELHYNNDINNKSVLRTTAFLSLGRGAGSSLNGGSIINIGPTLTTSGVFQIKRPDVGYNGTTIDTLLISRLNADGYIADSNTARQYLLANANQRISYSLHSQYGLLTSFSQDVSKTFKYTAGAEFRNWRADHPGQFTNLFGKQTINLTYASDTSTVAGVVKTATFSRPVYQGDLEGPAGDLGSPFSYNLATNDPTYRTQYRNYRGEVPQLTLFGQGNFMFNKLNIMTSLQYVWYKYTLTENMPSENAIGKKLTAAQVSALGLVNEGPDGAGKFYMKGTDNRFYEFTLVNNSRSRGFFQPKIGFNYNATQNINFFGNFAHVERFVDLGVYYNQGRINENAEDEKSNQFEAGFGFGNDDVNFKVNGYYMLWQNKAASIQDITQAGQPGYDRNGFKTELVGTSEHKGVEVELSIGIGKFIKVPGLGLTSSFTFMDNTWKEILASVINNPDGSLRVFNNNARNANGDKINVYYNDLLGKHLASGPQMMINAGLNYTYKSFFTGVDMNFAARDYFLDGETYGAITSVLIGTNGSKEIYQTTFDNQLPTRAIVGAYAGYNFNFNKKLKGQLTLQSANLFDKDYLASADRFGVIPGEKRTFRINLTIGL
ncbi:MAG: TonB-dependent receptor [Bacteroidetes bacterium]|nr:TonB-dependent receptor [Bacteroidota bacterium]